MTEEEDVDALLRQIALAKQKELRFRVEKKRIRDELEYLQAGTLWSREEETQRRLTEVRRAREQTEAQGKQQEEKLAGLNASLKAQEMEFRKATRPRSTLFQQAAASVVTRVVHSPKVLPSVGEPGTLCESKDATSPSLEKREEPSSSKATDTPDVNMRTSDYSSGSNPACAGNQECSGQEFDALQHLFGKINCEEQEKRVERLQAELKKANARRQEDGIDLPPVQLPRTSTQRSLADSTRPVTQTDGKYSPNHFRYSLATPARQSENSEFADQNQVEPPRKLSSKPPQLKALDGLKSGVGPHSAALPISTDQHLQDHSSHASAPMSEPSTTPVAPSSTAYPGIPGPPTPSYPHGYPLQAPSYPVFPPQFALPGYFNPYGGGFPPSYLPGYPFPTSTPIPWVHQASTFPDQTSFSAGALPQAFTGIPLATRPLNPVLQQQEEDVRRLERELEMQRTANEQKAEAQEFERLQGRLKQLQSKVSDLTAADSSSMGLSAEDFGGSEDEPSALKSLKRAHLENLVKVRNERDLLEEQEKLEELKERIQHRREEKKREQDHEDWVARQKRELIALRLQRAIEHDSGSHKATSDGRTSVEELGPEHKYDADSGFMLLWDFASGIPAPVTGIQITYAVFEGKLVRTPFKVVRSKEIESMGPRHNRCLFLSSRHIKKLPPSSDLRVIVEMSSVPDSSAVGQSMPKSLGWTAFSLFRPNERGLTLASGYFKLPLKQSPMVDPSKTLLLPPPIADCSDISIYIRLVHGEVAGEASQMAVDPISHAARYRIPGDDKLLPLKSRSKSPSTRRPSLQSKGDNVADSVASKPSDGQLRLSPSASAERLAQEDQSNPPHNEDFLDVERLRQISSASSRPSRPPSTRPRSNLPASRNDRSRLPAFREDIDAESDAPWIRVDNSADRQRRLLSGSPFQPGDGLNVHLDGGRGFPDNATISKVTVAALNADRTQVVVDNGSTFAAATSDVFNPSFGTYLEYRQQNFNPTLTLVIRIDTIEASSKLPIIMGYALLPVFLDIETRDQPARSSITQFVLNEGGFQLPLHTNIQSADTKQPFNSKAGDDFPRIPCATVLLRLVQAKMSGDGLSLRSQKDAPPEERNAAPEYSARLYDSLRCVPSAMEEKIYELRHKHRKTKLLSQYLPQVLPGDNQARDLLKAKPQGFMDLRCALRYQPTIGFRVAVDGLHNVKVKGGSFFRVLFSVYPPGSFYQPIRLTGEIHFTTTADWSSAQTSPEFADGYMTLRDSPSDRSLVVLFDVRSVVRHPKTGEISSQPFGWTFLPVLTPSRSVAAGAMQLPLFQGEVKLELLRTANGGALNTLVDEIASEKKKQLLPVIDGGASLFVRLEDPQLPYPPAQPIVNASVSKMIPPKSVAKYIYDRSKVAAIKKKAPLSKLLPASKSESELEKEINQAFAQEMGIHHYLF